MAIQVQLMGIEEVHNMIIQLPKNMEKEVDKVEEEFMKLIATMARFKAPKFSGQLAESIMWSRKKLGTYELIVDSPYAWFQEHGFKVRRNDGFLFGNMPVAGGYRIIDWMQFRGLPGFMFRPSGDPQPFVAPAVKIGLSHLPMMLDNAAFKAATEST